MTGQSKAAVLRSMNDGTLPTSNIGNRRFIRTGKSCIQDISKPDNAGPKKLRSREAASAFLGRREQFVPNGIELSELEPVLNWWIERSRYRGVNGEVA